MVKFLLRICLVAVALNYALPKVSGVEFHGDALGAVATSVVFNVVFSALEWLLGVVVFGVNVSTLGLGFLITGTLRFVAGLLTPSLALAGASALMPRFLEISQFFPNAVVAGLILGGLMWSAFPDKRKRR